LDLYTDILMSTSERSNKPLIVLAAVRERERERERERQEGEKAIYFYGVYYTFIYVEALYY
jgi:hypothetical protein